MSVVPRGGAGNDQHLHTVPHQLPAHAKKPFLRTVELTRLAMDGIQEEKARLQSTMRTRWAQAGFGALASIGAIVGLMWLIGKGEKATVPAIESAIMDQDKFRACQVRHWDHKEKNGPFKRALLQGLGFGTVAIALASFSRVFKALAGSTEDVVMSILRGYKGWFVQEEELLQGTLLELRESLHRARNNQAGKEGSLYGAAEQVTYYRSDVISQYEYVMWRFQNLIALMYLITPKRNHGLLTRDVEEIIAYNQAFADQLEKDCNQNTHGFWTKYSAETMMMFHANTECMKEFITRFKTKLCR
jgi:hypothetical protein